MDRYGKDIDFRKLSRGFADIQNLIQTTKEFSRRHLTDDSAINHRRTKCCICGSNSFAPFITVYGYNYVQCSNCNSLYLQNLPDVEALYTTEESPQGEIYMNEEMLQKRIEQIALPKIEFVMESFHNIKGEQENKLLWCDIGCGVGEILLGIKQMYADISAVGIESDPREIAFAKRNNCAIMEGFLNPQKTDPSLLNILSDSTIVSMFNVLEHIQFPDQVIQLLARTMRPGSLLVIEVPRHPSLASYANLTSDMYVYRHITPPIHLQIFSDVGMNYLLKDQFKIVSRWGFGQGFSDILLNALLKSSEQHKLIARQFYEQLFSITNKVQPVIDQAGYADQMIYVYMKI